MCSISGNHCLPTCSSFLLLSQMQSAWMRHLLRGCRTTVQYLNKPKVIHAEAFQEGPFKISHFQIPGIQQPCKCSQHLFFWVGYMTTRVWGGGRRPLITLRYLAPRVLITCKFCIEDLFVLLPDLLLVVLEQSLAQVAHLLHCE